MSAAVTLALIIGVVFLAWAAVVTLAWALVHGAALIEQRETEQ